MKVQLKDSEEIVEVSSARGAEMVATGEGIKVPVDGEEAAQTQGTSDEDSAPPQEN